MLNLNSRWEQLVDLIMNSSRSWHKSFMMFMRPWCSASRVQSWRDVDAPLVQLVPCSVLAWCWCSPWCSSSHVQSWRGVDAARGAVHPVFSPAVMLMQPLLHFIPCSVLAACSLCCSSSRVQSWLRAKLRELRALPWLCNLLFWNPTCHPVLAPLKA